MRKTSDLFSDRRWRNRFGAIAVPLCLATWIGLFAALAWRVPLLVNPFEASRRLHESSLDQGTLVLLATMCPIAMSTIGVLMLVVLLGMMAWTRSEARLLTMFDAASGPVKQER